MAREEVTDGLSFVRELVRRALWDIRYHECELPKVAAKMKFAKELLERAGIDVTKKHAGEVDDDGEYIAENVVQFACNIFADASSSIEWHETALTKAHKHMSFVQSLLARGSYTEINVAEIQKAVEKEKQ